MAFAPHDPLARLSWLARRRWRRAELRVRREFEAETLGELRQLAADGAPIAWTTPPNSGSTLEAGGILGPVELTAGGRRIAARAVWGPAWASLSAAAAQGRVVLAGAGRYGGSWLLRFRVVGGDSHDSHDSRSIREFPLLGAGIRIIPHSGGDGFRLPVIPPRQPALA
ncbi:MAG TPA: hypothetical protein VFZ97_10755 [Acidimicrobiales bacterium]